MKKFENKTVLAEFLNELSRIDTSEENVDYTEMELKNLNDRILFSGIKDNKYIIYNYFSYSRLFDNMIIFKDSNKKDKILNFVKMSYDRYKVKGIDYSDEIFNLIVLRIQEHIAYSPNLNVYSEDISFGLAIIMAYSVGNGIIFADIETV